MEDMLNDKRFAHLAKDPKFRRIPKNERKVKIDKRFKSMFKDKKFAVKYTVDKRGRPVNQSSTENLKKYYDISSSEDDSMENESDIPTQDKESKMQKTKQVTRKMKNKKKNIAHQEVKQDEEVTDNENYSSNGSLLIVKSSNGNSLDKQGIAEDSASDQDDNEKEENKIQLKTRRKNEEQLDNDVKKKLKDLTVDYARGEGVLISDSSSDEQSSDYDVDDDDDNGDDDEKIEHNWGELDKEAPTTEKITHRLAACNMDWDRIRATDLMVLFNSFLPTEGLIHSVTIYPSDFGLQRMKEEEIKGPIELVESKHDDIYDENKEKHTDDENEEGSSYHMEKLRQYQLNRLKYFYAVIDFDSASTANKVYTECDGLEYESSSTKLDLRFIPDDMAFENEPKEVCDKLPDLSRYQPRQFTTTALQQVKVDLTWDETNPERREISQKLNSGKLDEIDKNDIQAYLASGTSEDESEDEVKKQLKGLNVANQDENPIDKYKSLLKSIEEAEEEKKNKEVQLEFTWGLGSKEKSEKLVKEKMKQTVNLTPFEQYLEKRKAKKIAKREEKKATGKNYEDRSDSEDSIPDGIDMNDPYFTEELKKVKPKVKKRKNTLIIDNLDSADEAEQKKRQAELELLLMDENDEINKKHFSMKRIEEVESLTKSKKKRLSKKRKDLKDEADTDNFQVDVKDSRFEALFTSHHYNIDPADPHYRKTKGTEALISEKLKRRSKNSQNDKNLRKSTAGKKNVTNSNVNAELNTLIKSIKRNTENMSKRVK